MCAERPPLVLASASERRRELLRSAGVRFEVIPSAAPEDPLPDEDAHAFATRVAQDKARWVAAGLVEGRDARPILAADTVVVVDGEILGKPCHRADAQRMIERLEGREHEVITAFCILFGQESYFGSASTRVHFRPLSAPQIERYLDRADWADKAGAYAIQGEAGSLVRSIDGSHSNVIGLPVAEVIEQLRDLPGFEELV